MPGHTRAQYTLGKMSRSQLPSRRHMHSALNRHPHYCIRTTAGNHAAAGCSGLGVMYRWGGGGNPFEVREAKVQVAPLVDVPCVIPPPPKSYWHSLNGT